MFLMFRLGLIKLFNIIYLGGWNKLLFYLIFIFRGLYSSPQRGHRLLQEAPLTIWFLLDSNPAHSVCKADTVYKADLLTATL